MLLSDQENGVSTSEFDPFRSSIPISWTWKAYNPGRSPR